jgi:signal transduction histidine kinase
MASLRLRRPRPMEWLRARPLVFDTLIAGALAIIGVISHLAVRGEEISEPSVVGVILTLGATLPLMLRRRQVVGTLVVVLVAQIALEAMSAVGPGWLGVTIAAYSLGAYRSGRVLWIVGLSSWLAVTGFVLFGLLEGYAELGELISTGIVYASSIALGDNMRRRRERSAELVERAERAERERELLAHQQVQHERVRIARELHDVVAHSVSVMVIQAAAARRQLATNPAATEDVLQLIEQTGRDAMNEMRRMLGVLRNELPDAELEPQPSMAQLSALVEADGDLPTELRLLGPVGAVPAGIELSAYRIVQEALTNVRRHAGRVDHVDVMIDRRSDELVVEVADDGRGVVAALSSNGVGDDRGREPISRGFGLVGMRERVAAFDGELLVGPRPDGGWRVRARFPLPPPNDESIHAISGSAPAAQVSSQDAPA